MSYHSPWACRVLLRNQSDDNHMGIHLYVIYHFSFVAFNFFFPLITMCLGMFFLGFILPETLWASWTWVTVSFPMLGMFLTIISSDIFSGWFSLYSPSGTPIMRMLMHLMLSRGLSDCLHFFLFLFFLFHGSDFHHSVFHVTYLFFYFSYSAVDSF